MFALAANGFNKPSETFIRAHAAGLAPGNTLLIAERKELQRPIKAPLILFSKRLPIWVGETGGAWDVMRGLLDPSRLSRTRDAYLAHLLRRQGVTAMMVEYGVCGIHLMDAAMAAGCRFFVHFHGVDASTALNDPDVLTAYERMFRIAAGIIAPSRFIADKLQAVGCPADKLHVVPCGVDLSTIPHAQPVGESLLAVGRMTEKKAPLKTIQAFAKIKAAHPAASLTMLGDGPLFDHAKAEVARLGLTDAVKLPGMVTAAQVREAMHQTRIFLQHSVTASNGDVEGLPVAILEAMAAGLPVVSTQHSGIPEAVQDGITGALVVEGDIDGMADRVIDLLNHPTKGAKYGAAGRKSVTESFDIAITNGKLRDIIGLASPAT